MWSQSLSKAWWGALLLVFAVLVVFESSARAQASPTAVATIDEPGPIELLRTREGFVGSFSIRNTGAGVLDVARVIARTSIDDPRMPPGVSVELDNGGQTAQIASGRAARAIVRWRPGPEVKARELYGQILVESNSTAEGATAPARPIAVGVHAERGVGLGFIGDHVLSILVFLPLLGLLAALLAQLTGRGEDRRLRRFTVLLMGTNLALATWLYATFDTTFSPAHGNDGFQFIERAVWVRSLNVEYFLGVDGVSISMVLLTALISFVGAIASYSVKPQLKGYFAMYCLLVTGMMGVFVALDLFLFFVFWELMLLPMYFLIGIWGGIGRKYAAIKFFLYTLAGSVFMLLGFIWLYLNADPTYLGDGQAVSRTFAIPELMRVAWLAKDHTILGMSAVKLVFAWLFVGFAIKIPMFPFHTWLPDAHVEAPTAISVVLAGILLKMGLYGLLRINLPILPEASQWAAPAMAAFGVINILYGAFCAMAQTDLKRLVAYSSVSHMGFGLLALGALTPQGIQACLVQMFNHGIITAMLFVLVGVLYDRVHTRDIDRFGGLAEEMPLFAAMVGFAFMASLGLPGLSGFWGEAMTFIGAFPRYQALTVGAVAGVVVIAAYHLWALQRVFLGPFQLEWRKSKYLEPFGGRFPEINRRELMSIAPLAVLILVLGFWPRPLLELSDRASITLHRIIERPGPPQIASTPHTAAPTARR